MLKPLRGFLIGESPNHSNVLLSRAFERPFGLTTARSCVHGSMHAQAAGFNSDDALGENQFSSDDYFIRERPRSFLCLPLQRRSAI
jgi:hypothetical protein